MTNGEIIKQIFPNLIEYDMGDNNLVVVYIDKARINIPKDYWNAEFKEPNDTKTITISKGAVKHGNKDYVVYKRDWLMEHLDSEFEVLKGARKLGEKIKNAKPSTWLTDGLTQEEIEQAIKDGKERAIHCKNCKYLEEVNGEHCYECVKEIENNYEPMRDCDLCKHYLPFGVRDMWGTVSYTYRCASSECNFEQKGR